MFLVVLRSHTSVRALVTLRHGQSIGKSKIALLSIVAVVVGEGILLQ